MKKYILILFALFISCTTQYKKSNNVYVEAFPNLSFEFPVDIQSPKDGTNRILVLSQPGVIYAFDNISDIKEKKIFLDIRGKVLYGGEMGLLGLAFHPNYQENGFFYLDYTTDNPRRTVISRFKVS